MALDSTYTGTGNPKSRPISYPGGAGIFRFRGTLDGATATLKSFIDNASEDKQDAGFYDTVTDQNGDSVALAAAGFIGFTLGPATLYVDITGGSTSQSHTWTLDCVDPIQSRKIQYLSDTSVASS